MPKVYKIILTLITSLFLITRLYKIDQIPPSVYWDEASIGYNAYSISQSGRDEWGKLLPIHFRAFGEFKLPIYIYSVIPFVKLFGLNEFSVRIPAVLFSLGSVFLTFALAKKINNSFPAGLWSSFFITISPWFFIFSRTGYEATAGLMFYLLGIYLFLDLERKSWFILASTSAFILSTYSYNSFRIISPLTIFILIIFKKNNLKQIFIKHKIFILSSIILIILAIIPIYRLYVFDAGGARLQAVRASYKEIISNYFSHFNASFLFINGDKNLRSQQTGFGQLYIPDLVLILMGLIFIIRRKVKQDFIILSLLLLGPIPAALTKESPHALRSLSMVPFFSMIWGLGALYIGKIVKIKYLTIVLTIIFLGFFLRYFIYFTTNYSSQSEKDWQEPYKKIYVDYKDEFGSYDHILISDEYAQPYIFALFYLKYDPEKFRSEVVRNSVDQWGFSTVSNFGKFKFGKIKQLSKTTFGKNLIFDLGNNQVYEQKDN